MVTSADEARAVVGLAKTNGFNFIKVYNNLSLECFFTLVKEARREGLGVAGHGVTDVGLERQLDAGQIMVAHAEEFLYTFFSHPKDPPSDAPPKPELIPSAIALIKRNKAFVTADLNTYGTIARQLGRPEVVDGFLRAPEVRYLAPNIRMQWRKEDYAKRKGDLTPQFEFLKIFISDMSKAGVPLIAGTDAPTIPGIFPGYSLRDDLAALEEAGLTRYNVLSSATRNAGELVHRSVPGAENFGTVTLGGRADLVLTSSNPLDDLSTLRKPIGVMAYGNWYSAPSLDALLGSVAKEYDDACASFRPPSLNVVDSRTSPPVLQVNSHI